MNEAKFKKFLGSLNIEPTLLEAILDGYNAVFTESFNAWRAENFPMINPVGTPMGSYDNIMKQLPSSIGAVGGSGSSTRGGNGQYRYYASLPGSHRDLKHETIHEWENAPKFKKIKPQKSKMTEKLMNRAEEHIPDVGSKMYAPINSYQNFHLGRYDVDTRNNPF
jgi:hypothetical protein